jgi:hypothetical protein
LVDRGGDRIGSIDVENQMDWDFAIDALPVRAGDSQYSLSISDARTDGVSYHTKKGPHKPKVACVQGTRRLPDR